MRFVIYSLPAAIGAFVTLAVASSTARRGARGARTFTLLMVTMTVLLAGSAIATSSPTFEQALLAQRFSSASVSALPLLFLIFAAQFAGVGFVTSKPVVFVLTAITVAYIAASSIEPWSKLITAAYSFTTDGGYAAITRTRGPLWLPFVIFTSVEVLTAIGILVRAAVMAPPAFRRQMAIIACGAVIPFSGGLIQYAGGAPLRGYDLSGVTYSVFGLLVAWALAKYQGLTVSPVRQSELRASMVANMSDVVIAIDSAGKILDMNPPAERLLGVSVNEAFGLPLGQLAPQLADWNLDHRPDWIVSFDDERASRDLEVRTMFVSEKAGEGPGRLLMLRDITVQLQLEAELKRRAYQDSLTGLANRFLFMEKLRAVLSRKSPTAVLFLDLDGFKTVNDSLGHDEGDALLSAIASRLRSLLDPDSLLARFGGDEFVVLMSPIQSEEAAGRIARDLLSSFAAPYRLPGREVEITASVGLSVDLGEGRHAEDLIREADSAMYAAKNAGKARVERYRPEMHERALRRLSLGGQLSAAIEDGDLLIRFAKVLDPASGGMVASEAVVTWPHPERGTIESHELMTLALERGLATKLSRWLVRESCRALSAWRAGRPVRDRAVIRITLPAQVLRQPALSEEVKRTLAEFGLPPACLWLDVYDASARETLSRIERARLVDAGVRLGNAPGVDSKEASVPIDRTVGSLTSREMDVALLMAEGLSNPKIAERLFLSPNTVNGYAKSVLAKLNARSRTQVVAYVLRTLSARGQRTTE